MKHILKLKDKYFDEVLSGRKSFELRKNDRNYSVGDTLILNEIDKNGKETGRRLQKRISYILKDCPEYGLKDGYCILSLDFIYMWETYEEYEEDDEE